MTLRAIGAAEREPQGAPASAPTWPAAREAVVEAAAALFGSPGASLLQAPPDRADGSLTARLELSGGTWWLTVAPRTGVQPFDEADRNRLEALAALAATALDAAGRCAEAEREVRRLSQVIGSLGEGVCAIDGAGQISYMNPAGARMLGWSEHPGGVRESGDEVRVPGNDPPRFLLDPAMRAMALAQDVVTDDIRVERADGSQLRVTLTASPMAGAAQPAAAVVVFRDTSDRKAFEEQLAQHAFQDPLTRLANRRLLLDHLDHALLQAGRSESRVALLFGDLDRFKVVNDKLGHQMGDEFLRAVAERLRRAVRPGDTLSRFGGDEFVVVLEGIATADDARQVAERVLDSLRHPVELSGGHEVMATMSIGMALSRPEGSTPR